MRKPKLSRNVKKLSKTVKKQTKHTPLLRTVGGVAVSVLSFIAAKTDPRYIRRLKRHNKKQLQKHARAAKARLKHA